VLFHSGLVHLLWSCPRYSLVVNRSMVDHWLGGSEAALEAVFACD